MYDTATSERLERDGEEVPAEEGEAVEQVCDRGEYCHVNRLSMVDVSY